MSFSESEQFILSLNNLPRREYQNDPKHCDLYLKRLQFFLDILGNPERKIPHYIHIAGTSGKGSVTAFLHSILQANGKKVGSTQSPHPTTITERWRIGNHQMTKKEFVELVEYIKPKLDQYMATTPYDMLSFFEVLEAIGFVYFAKNNINWVVLETGCGGRYDSTNVIPHKDVAVITTIGLDHVGVIGNNKEEIAYEKAGIIKHGCRVFTMERDAKLLAIIKKEAEKNEVAINHVTRITYHVTRRDISQTNFDYDNQSYRLQTIGEHQINNAILCIEATKSLGISENAIKIGLAKTKQHLRMEIVSHQPLIILDGAHNPDKMRSTVETLQHINTTISKATKQSKQYDNKTIEQYNNVHLITGFSADKDITQMIKQLATLKPQSIACTRNTINPFRKVADPQNLARQFKKLLPKTKIQIFLDPADALVWSQKQAKKNDIILCTGSIFLSGEMRKKIK